MVENWDKRGLLLVFCSAVPGGSDGPSGVLVCCENYLLYKNFGDQPDIRCPIPRRKVILNTVNCSSSRQLYYAFIGAGGDGPLQ